MDSAATGARWWLKCSVSDKASAFGRRPCQPSGSQHRQHGHGAGLGGGRGSDRQLLLGQQSVLGRRAHRDGAGADEFRYPDADVRRDVSSD